MYNGGKIIAGLIILVALVTFPIFYNMGKPVAMPEPKLDTPEIRMWEKEKGKKECVEAKSFMRANHMQLLNDWRDWAVRDGKRVYVNAEGKHFTISLQNTCMHCHSNKKEFCDSCHTYANVKPYCWSCHLAPKEKGT